MKQNQSAYQLAQTIDLVDYLSSLGHSPQRIKEPDYGSFHLSGMKGPLLLKSTANETCGMTTEWEKGETW